MTVGSQEIVSQLQLSKLRSVICVCCQTYHIAKQTIYRTHSIYMTRFSLLTSPFKAAVNISIAFMGKVSLVSLSSWHMAGRVGLRICLSYGLNFVPLKFICWSPIPQCVFRDADGKFNEVLRGGPWFNRISVLIRKHTREWSIVLLFSITHSLSLFLYPYLCLSLYLSLPLSLSLLTCSEKSHVRTK